jgi:hypothetical protein
MSEVLLDRAGRRRSPATMPGFHAGHAPGNKGPRYPADPPKIEEIIAVMRAAGNGTHGRRLRGLIVVMWRAGLRIQEALALTEGDLDQGADRYWSGAARADAAARSAWTPGDGHNCSPGLAGDANLDGGDAKVAVSELALDDDQRYAFARDLDGVGVAELVRSETASYSCGCGGTPQLGACRRG